MSEYTVYLVESLGNTLNHHAIFVETKADGSGEVFHVKGNIQEGMSYEAKSIAETPDESLEFISKAVIGRVKAENLHIFKSICSANPPPEKQFNGPRRINKNKPLRRCQEWASETIAQLRAEGILE